MLRSLGSQARLHVASPLGRFGISQAQNLVVLRRWVHEDRSYEELFKTPCYANFATVDDGRDFLDSAQLLVNQDYLVRGIDTYQRSVSDYIDTSVGFWLDAEIIANEIQGGFACDLLGYKEGFNTLELYLRKKSKER